MVEVIESLKKGQICRKRIEMGDFQWPLEKEAQGLSITLHPHLPVVGRRLCESQLFGLQGKAEPHLLVSAAGLKVSSVF